MGYEEHVCHDGKEPISFGQYAEELRRQTQREQNTPIVIVLQNGVARACKISRQALSIASDKKSLVGLEVLMQISATEIKGGPE